MALLCAGGYLHQVHLMDGVLLKLLHLQHIFLPKHHLQIRNLRGKPHVFWQCFLLGAHKAVTACAGGCWKTSSLRSRRCWSDFADVRSLVCQW